VGLALSAGDATRAAAAVALLSDVSAASTAVLRQSVMAAVSTTARVTRVDVAASVGINATTFSLVLTASLEAPDAAIACRFAEAGVANASTAPNILAAWLAQPDVAALGLPAMEAGFVTSTPTALCTASLDDGDGSNSGVTSVLSRPAVLGSLSALVVVATLLVAGGFVYARMRKRGKIRALEERKEAAAINVLARAARGGEGPSCGSGGDGDDDAHDSGGGVGRLDADAAADAAEVWTGGGDDVEEDDDLVHGLFVMDGPATARTEDRAGMPIVSPRPYTQGSIGGGGGSGGGEGEASSSVVLESLAGGTLGWGAFGRSHRQLVGSGGGRGGGASGPLEAGSGADALFGSGGPDALFGSSGGSSGGSGLRSSSGHLRSTSDRHPMGLVNALSSGAGASSRSLGPGEAAVAHGASMSAGSQDAVANMFGDAGVPAASVVSTSVSGSGSRGSGGSGGSGSGGSGERSKRMLATTVPAAGSGASSLSSGSSRLHRSTPEVARGVRAPPMTAMAVEEDDGAARMPPWATPIAGTVTRASGAGSALARTLRRPVIEPTISSSGSGGKESDSREATGVRSTY